LYFFKTNCQKTAKYLKNVFNLLQMQMIFRKLFPFMKTLECFLFIILG